MGWIKKILKGLSSSNKYSGKHNGRYDKYPQTTGDALSDFDSEEIDRAIALSLLEEDAKSVVSTVEEDGHDDDDDDDDEDDHCEHADHHDDEDDGDEHDVFDDEDDDDERSVSSVEEDNQNHTISSPEDDETESSYLSDEDNKGKKPINYEDDTEDDEQLAKALQESLNIPSPPRNHPSPPRNHPSPPRNHHESVFPPVSYFYPSGYRICIGCNTEIGHGRFLNCMGGLWHPECFRCHTCNLPISDHEFSMSENRQFHKSCYKEHHHPRCDVCKHFIPTNGAGLIEYRAHPFWLQKYCPSHEHDGTPRCCSCERMEARDTKYLLLDDGRKLCLECLDSAIMDTHECQPLYLEIQDFYEGLNMKIEQQVPLLLVERQALNEAMEGEKNGQGQGHHHMPETRGLCLSEEQTISTIIRRPKVGAGRIMDMFTEPYKLVRRCEVTAILILYSLPRLLTGSILAHEMMHAWLRLKGYSNLPPKVEEGICQVLAHMWLESEIMAGSGGTNIASTSSSSSSSSAPAGESSKKGKRSDFEKQLGGFFKHQIESDSSEAYGEGFREGNRSVVKYGLRSTLDHIRLTGTFPL
ncbi:putative transcription factor interactor and regulator LIM family [Helianthus annuus]|uniref:Transcription factor interactor and regulator LIM family n=2 Tax=Helianthus annuus TaxID=4232 RepID=A0A9K3E003_HELAN|nr:protein DA1-related 1 isoform X1 [Helianthus annuus]XP_022011304.1 protein DA1-related 1 isoform X1 [Helianthus annuus]XP_022011305.1 protein DA1-related 1 isoform X1 [Helianthus annuus]XP_035839620.1 protein DA1-related 1 isoform X1 [Helianthus annuus]XP_035839621.1 protein DA1-related 1 isoform X1 [Helianthus annuus]KAF5763712.1 putative transcription factor interactor and regulator LIM family [Helianthus annuus]KAJ0454637.1 putative transcription factor interactor and regulator LIM fami